MDKLLDFLDGWIERNGTLNSSDTDTLKKFMTGLGSEIDSLSVCSCTIKLDKKYSSDIIKKKQKTGGKFK